MCVDRTSTKQTRSSPSMPSSFLFVPSNALFFFRTFLITCFIFFFQGPLRAPFFEKPIQTIRTPVVAATPAPAAALAAATPAAATTSTIAATAAAAASINDDKEAAALLLMYPDGVSVVMRIQRIRKLLRKLKAIPDDE